MATKAKKPTPKKKRAAPAASKRSVAYKQQVPVASFSLEAVTIMVWLFTLLSLVFFCLVVSRYA